MSITWQYRLRCVGFWMRGFFGVRPVPYHRDYRCWSSGATSRISLIVVSIPFAIFAAGAAFSHFFIG